MRELKRIAQEMGGVVSMAGKAEFTTNRLAVLQDRVTHLNDRLTELRQQSVAIDAEHTDPRDIEAALHEFDPLWGQLSTWEQERFIRTLVEQVRYDGKTGTVTLGFRSQGSRTCAIGRRPSRRNTSMHNSAVEIQFRLHPTGRAADSGAPSDAPRSTAGRLPRVTQVMALAVQFQDMIQRGDARDYADLARLGASRGNG